MNIEEVEKINQEIDNYREEFNNGVTDERKNQITIELKKLGKKLLKLSLKM